MDSLGFLCVVFSAAASGTLLKGDKMYVSFVLFCLLGLGSVMCVCVCVRVCVCVSLCLCV